MSPLLFLLPLASAGYYLLCAYCDQTENPDGSNGSFPFKNRLLRKNEKP